MMLAYILDRLPYFGYRRQLRRRIKALRSQSEIERLDQAFKDFHRHRSTTRLLQELRTIEREMK